MPSSHDLVTIGLVYLAVGSCLWMVLELTGIVGSVLASWQAKGRFLAGASFVIAVTMVIFGWPWFLIRSIAEMFRDPESSALGEPERSILRMKREKEGKGSR